MQQHTYRNMEDAMMGFCQCRGHCVWLSGLEGIDSYASTCVRFLIDQKRSMHHLISQPLFKQKWNFILTRATLSRKGDLDASSPVRGCCITFTSTQGTRHQNHCLHHILLSLLESFNRQDSAIRAAFPSEPQYYIQTGLKV